MAHDPLIHVASWLTPTPDVAGASPATADDTIVSLFHDWIAVESNSDVVLATAGEGAEYEAAVDRITELEHAIADARSASTAGVAIKAYVRLSSEVTFGKSVEERLARSVLGDIIRLAPVLAPRAAGAIGEHAAARGWAP